MGHLGTSNRSGRDLGGEVKRLDSWKEIAAYFGKDVRTVRRWERDRRLPVHRIPGSERSGVFAYVPELVSWLHRAKPEEADAKEFAGAREGGVQGAASASGERRRMHGRRATDSRDGQPVVRIDQPVNQPVAQMDPTAILNRGSSAVEAPAQISVLPGLPPVRSRLSRWRVGGWLILLSGLTLAAAYPFLSGEKPGGVQRLLSPNSTREADVRDLYLQGRAAWSLRTEASLKEAVDLFTQTIVLDPGYAAAYTGLADSYILLRQYGHMPDAEAFPRAMAASEQALRLDHGSAGAHRTHAMLMNSWLWNFPAAEQEFRQAIELDPKDAQSHHWYATALQSVGRFADGLREIEIARQLEPDSLVIQANRDLLLQYVDLDEATRELQGMAQQHPNASFVHSHLARAYLRKNDVQSFMREEKQKALLLPDDAEAKLLEDVQQGSEASSPETVLARLADGYGRLTDGGGQYATRASYLYASIGNAEKTLHYLKVSSERREDDFRSIGYENVYRFLNGNAEFQDLLKRGSTPRGTPTGNRASMSFPSSIYR